MKMPNQSKVLVIARNARTADLVARSVGVERQSDYTYVHDQYHLQGLTHADVYVYTGGDGSYPHDAYEQALRRAAIWPDTFVMHYVSESDL